MVLGYGPSLYGSGLYGSGLYGSGLYGSPLYPYQLVRFRPHEPVVDLRDAFVSAVRSVYPPSYVYRGLPTTPGRIGYGYGGYNAGRSVVTVRPGMGSEWDGQAIGGVHVRRPPLLNYSLGA